MNQSNDSLSMLKVNVRCFLSGESAGSSYALDIDLVLDMLTSPVLVNFRTCSPARRWWTDGHRTLDAKYQKTRPRVRYDLEVVTSRAWMNILAPLMAQRFAGSTDES